jgi:hypothetical protein
MPIFKVHEWLDENHPDVKAYRARMAAQKIDKLTLDIVQAEKRHELNLRIFNWVFKAVCFLVIIWIVIEVAAIK